MSTQDKGVKKVETCEVSLQIAASALTTTPENSNVVTVSTISTKTVKDRGVDVNPSQIGENAVTVAAISATETVNKVNNGAVNVNPSDNSKVSEDPVLGVLQDVNAIADSVESLSTALTDVNLEIIDKLTGKPLPRSPPTQPVKGGKPGIKEGTKGGSSGTKGGSSGTKGSK